MSLDFVAIDFETANRSSASACALAVIVFKDGKVAEEHSWLIRPHEDVNFFNYFNVLIHGITYEQVQDKPQFDELWPTILGLMDKQMVVAHNAVFDIGVLKSLLVHYELDYPDIDIICSCNLARKTWDGQVDYKLNSLASKHGFTFRHHDAHDDAVTCGNLRENLCRGL